MRRILFTILLFVLPGYSQTPQPSNLTVNTVTATSGMTTPSIKIGNGGPALVMPTSAPFPNALLAVQSVTQSGSGTSAQTQWAKGYNGTVKLTATCSLNVTNGLITGVTGCR